MPPGRPRPGLTEIVGPFAGGVEDRNDLHPLAQSVDSDVGRAGNDQLACRVDTTSAPHLRMVSKSRHRLHNPSHDAFGARRFRPHAGCRAQCSYRCRQDPEGPARSRSDHPFGMNFRITACTASEEAKRPSSAAFNPALIFSICQSRTSAETSSLSGGVIVSEIGNGFVAALIAPI